MRTIDKLEQKIGKYAIPNLMLYLIILYLIGFILNIVAPGFYDEYLALSASKILHGQVWRIITYLCYPPSTGILWFAIISYVYFSLARSLERLWGTFRFNLYLFIGIFANVIAALIIYAIWGVDAAITANQLYLTMLLGMAVTIPDMTFLLFFILPVKAKWLGIFYGGLLVYDVVTYALSGYWANVIAIVMSMLNFFVFIFFIKPKNVRNASPRKNVFKMKFERQPGGATRGRGAGTSSADDATTSTGNASSSSYGASATSRPVMHRCAICGITDVDDPNMTFRYCSKCAGAREYCEDHLYTHEHVTE